MLVQGSGVRLSSSMATTQLAIESSYTIALNVSLNAETQERLWKTLGYYFNFS
jgi:hypothetical protein